MNSFEILNCTIFYQIFALNDMEKNKDLKNLKINGN